MKDTLLLLGAHPDDSEAGAGGLAADLAAAGWRVALFVATTGWCGGAPEIRRREQWEAAGVLNAEVVWRNFPDGELPYNRATVSRLEALLATYDPRLIATHWPKDTHQDYRRLGLATMAAARRRPNVLFFEGPSSYKFEPTVYHPIDGCYETKLHAHGSQLGRTALAEFVTATAARRGFESRLGTRAEGFVPLRTTVILTEGSNGGGPYSRH